MARKRLQRWPPAQESCLRVVDSWLGALTPASCYVHMFLSHKTSTALNLTQGLGLYSTTLARIQGKKAQGDQNAACLSAPSRTAAVESALTPASCCPRAYLSPLMSVSSAVWTMLARRTTLSAVPISP